MSELNITLLHDEEGLMGEVRPMFCWPPLTLAQYIKLATLAPDRALARAAAIEYLDKHEPKITTYSACSLILPAVLIVLLTVTLALAAWAIL